jgi:hypothetical protein
VRFQFQPVCVPVESDGEGLLVLVNGWLIALLVRLAAEHGDITGHWFVETIYGNIGGGEHPVFADLAQAEHWFASQFADRRSADHLWKIDGLRDQPIIGQP